MNEETKQLPNWIDRFKKMGLLAFLFFFVKGLVWIALFLGAGSYFTELF